MGSGPQCKGCPLETIGKGFVPGHGPADATVAIIGSVPDEADVTSGYPLTGTTWATLVRDFLPFSGIDTEEIYRDHVIRCRPAKAMKSGAQRASVIPQGKLLADAIAHCSQYDTYLATITLLIPLGKAALTKFSTESFESRRGHLLEGENTNG